MTKIAIIGEAWGEHEERQRAPFVGPSGYELTRMLGEAGIHRADCFLTNVFNLRPRPNNDIENLCGPDKVGGLPALKNGKYVRREFHSELNRLYSEIRLMQPNLCILLGNTACWAFLGNQGITKVRGTITASTPLAGGHDLAGTKCIPAYHPAAILRQWDLRPVTVLDFKKARREAEFKEIRRPERTIHIVETLQDIETYYDQYLHNAASITFDIETMRDQITCIGFAPSPYSSLVIPFHDPRSPTGSFWSSHEAEEKAWESVRRILALPCRKTAQNGMYDIHFLWRAVGITVNNFEDDTMLLHHALQPESEKGLAFLGSVYTNESSWKLLNARKSKTIKRDS